VGRVCVTGFPRRYILNKTKARQVKVAPMSQSGHGLTLEVALMSRRDMVKQIRG